MVDLRQSPAFAQYLTSLGWIIEQGIFIRKLGIFGAVAKIQRGKVPKDWKKILKKHRVWMFEINHSPSKTLRINLKLPLKNIYNNFKKDARYTLRKISNNQYSTVNNDFDIFYDIWQKSAKRKSLWIPKHNEYKNLISFFDNKCFCITINHEAGALILIHNKCAYYYYAGATKTGVKQNLPYLVIWKCIQEAKKRGCVLWDFEGIYDNRFPNNEWLGFSHFKKSFGGNEVTFPGKVTRWGW